MAPVDGSSTKRRYQNSRRMSRNTRFKYADSPRRTLYVVTGVVKSKSWTLGSFYNGLDGCEILVRRRSSGDGIDPCTYKWMYEVNVDDQQGPQNNNYVNQTVIIKGFKLTMWNGWLPIVEMMGSSTLASARTLAGITSDLLRYPSSWVKRTGKSYFDVVKPSSTQIVHSCGLFPVSARRSVPEIISGLYHFSDYCMCKDKVSCSLLTLRT